MRPMAGHTRGTGSYYLRGNVYWISYWVGGQQIKESTRSSDEAEAQRQLKVKIGEAAAGKDVSPSRATVNDICGLVLADHKLRKLRDTINVKSRIDGHLKKLLGSLLASRCTPHQIRQYVEVRRKEKAAEATINRELAILRRGFALAMREDPPLVRQAPYIPKLEEDNARQGFIEREQYELLLATLPERLKCLLVVGYHTGCRLGELRKLRWVQVDFDARLIRVEKHQAKGKEPRTIPIYGDMVEWLESQRDYCRGERLFCFKRQSKDGRPTKELAIGEGLKGWDEACTAAGLDGLLFHDLRRSAVRNMERAGIPRSVAMKISGHATESVYRRYDIVAEGDLKAAAQKLTDYHKRQRPRLKIVGK